jgi:hypothetical protein
MRDPAAGPARRRFRSDVVPLPLGNLTAGAIPDQLEQGVLGRGHGHRKRLTAHDDVSYDAPRELHLVVGIGQQREDVELIAAGKVDQVERPARPQGVRVLKVMTSGVSFFVANIRAYAIR